MVRIKFRSRAQILILYCIDMDKQSNKVVPEGLVARTFP